MEELIALLMKRDHASRGAVIEQLKETQESIRHAVMIGDYGDADNILMEDLGLEPDYIVTITMEEVPDA
jgi:hypothetical protein